MNRREIEVKSTAENIPFLKLNLLEIGKLPPGNQPIVKFQADLHRAQRKVTEFPEYFAPRGGRGFDYVKNFALCNFCNRSLGQALLSCSDWREGNKCCHYPKICLRCSYVFNQEPLKNALSDAYMPGRTYLHVTASLKNPVPVDINIAPDDCAVLFESFHAAVVELKQVPSKNSKAKLKEQCFQGGLIFHEFKLTELYPVATVLPHTHFLVLLLEGISTKDASQRLERAYRRHLRRELCDPLDKSLELSLHISELTEEHYYSVLRYRKPVDFVPAYEAAMRHPDVDILEVNYNLLDAFGFIHPFEEVLDGPLFTRFGCFSGRSKKHHCHKIKDFNSEIRQRAKKRYRDLAKRGAMVQSDVFDEDRRSSP